MQNLLTECDVTCVCDCTPPAQALSTAWLAAALTTLAGAHTAQVSCNGGVADRTRRAGIIHGIGNDLRAHDVSQAGLVDSPAVQVLRRVLLVPSTSCRAKKYLSGGRRSAVGEQGKY